MAELLLASLVPVFLFVIVEWKYGQRAGVVTALVLTMLLFVYLHLRLGGLDKLYLFEFGLLIVLGIVSLTKNNARFFKFQPAIIGFLIACYVFYLHFSGGSLFARMLPILDATAPEVAAFYRQPHMEDVLRSVGLNLGITFFAYALVVGYAAICWSSRGWLLVRLAIYPASFLVMAFSMAVKG